MAQLAQVLQLWMTLAHLLECLSPHVELTALQPRPTDYSFTIQICSESLHVEMPIAIHSTNVDAILGVDRRNHCVPQGAPCMRVGQLSEHSHVDWDTVVLHQGRCSDGLAMVQGNTKIKFRLCQETRQQPFQRIHVADAVGQNLHPFFFREWPTSHDAISHHVLLLWTDGVEPVVTQCANQAFAFGDRTAVYDISECWAEIDNSFRRRPIETKMT